MHIKTLGAAAAVALSLTACYPRPIVVNTPPPAPAEPVVIAVPVEVPAPMPMPPVMNLHDRVHDALMAGMGSQASRIEVRVDGSNVYLSGRVPNKAAHDRAHQIAHDVAGVTNVNHDALKFP